MGQLAALALMMGCVEEVDDLDEDDIEEESLGEAIQPLNNQYVQPRYATQGQ
jgi:hypothetical protein